MAIQSVQGHYLTWYQIMATNNPCYQKNVKRQTTTRLILHSVGANNAWLKRWISPDDGQIGDDGVYNGWNTTSCDTLVHFVIGLDKNGVSRAYQMAPLDLRVWGCGSGSNGSGNDIAIQAEMTEDTSMGASLAKQNYAVAVNLFASLCKDYGLRASAIWSHKEAHAAGYASNHGDPESWFKSSGSSFTMDGFRKDVQAVLDTGVPYGAATASTTQPSTQLYRVRKTWADVSSQIGAYAVLENAKKACKEGYKVFDKDGNVVYDPAGGTDYLVKINTDVLNVRKGPGTNYAVTTTVKRGGVYTIVGEASGTGASKWLKLKSGAGYISADYVVKM